MKRTLAAAFLIATGASSAIAADAKITGAQAKDLLTKHGCLTCHRPKDKLVGPSYMDVANKYKGQDVVAKLSEKIKKGGSGVWGAVAMRPHPNVPDADIKSLVVWILDLANKDAGAAPAAAPAATTPAAATPAPAKKK